MQKDTKYVVFMFRVFFTLAIKKCGGGSHFVFDLQEQLHNPLDLKFFKEGQIVACIPLDKAELTLSGQSKDYPIKEDVVGI